MQRIARLKRELKMFQESPPFGVSCWAKEDSLEELEARKKLFIKYTIIVEGHIILALVHFIWEFYILF